MITVPQAAENIERKFPEITFGHTGGNSPFQADGTVLDDYGFYFRFRHNRLTLSIGPVYGKSYESIPEEFWFASKSNVTDIENNGYLTEDAFEALFVEVYSSLRDEVTVLNAYDEVETYVDIQKRELAHLEEFNAKFERSEDKVFIARKRVLNVFVAVWCDYRDGLFASVTEASEALQSEFDSLAPNFRFPHFEEEAFAVLKRVEGKING